MKLTAPPSIPTSVEPSIARVNANNAYWAASERLANASVAKHAIDAEFAEALKEFTAARAAALSQGVVTP